MVYYRLLEAYQSCVLQPVHKKTFKETFPAYMLSAVLNRWRSYPTMLLSLKQLVHQRSTPPNPLVLRRSSFSFHSLL